MRWRMKLTTHTVARIGSQTRTPATRYRRRLRFFVVPGPSMISAPLLARPPLGRGAGRAARAGGACARAACAAAARGSARGARRARFGFGGLRLLGLLGLLGLRRRR